MTEEQRARDEDGADRRDDRQDEREDRLRVPGRRGDGFEERHPEGDDAQHDEEPSEDLGRDAGASRPCVTGRFVHVRTVGPGARHVKPRRRSGERRAICASGRSAVTPGARGRQRDRVDRARDGPRARAAVQVAGDHRRVADREGEVLRRPGRAHGWPASGRRRRPASQVVEVGELLDLERQRTPGARPAEDRDREHLGQALGAGRVIRGDLGQGDGLDGAATLGGDRHRQFQAGTGRVARVDQHEPAAPDEVRRDRLARDAAAGRHDDARHLGRQDGRDGFAEPPGRQALADLGDGPGVLELLEGAARRDPHREGVVGHGGERGRRRHPGVSGDLVALEAHARAGRQLRREEARIEPARQDRRGDPARERDEPVRPEREVQVRRDRSERRLATDERGSSL